VKDETPRDATAASPEVKEHTDEALALEFARRHSSFFRYVSDWNRWMIYDGEMWVRDELMRVYSESRALCREDSIAASKTMKAKILSARTVNAIVSLARSDPILAAVVDQWDHDPMALNCRGEVHQLDDDRFSRMAIPGDYLTKSTTVKPSGDCPLWIEFLEKVTAGDAALVDYLQRVCGYCLTGSTQEQCLFFLYGPGGNGKTTFVNTISGVMGDYAKTAAIDAFSQTGNDRHPTELANLQGARLVVASETAEGRRWDETRIKTLTGGETISARFMRMDFFEYRPVLKLMVSGNHKPELKGVDEAWRRRMQIIPFTVRIPASERIFGLEQLLRLEWPGILAWMIEGARHWSAMGLQPPPAVMDATEEYLEGEDVLGGWIEETIDFAPADEKAFLSRQALFGEWSLFCKNTGEKIGTRKQFVVAINRRKGFNQHKRDGVRGYLGMRFKEHRPPKDELNL
jgi:putative DNA primase/helicase